jgi:hypothetical protein
VQAEKEKNPQASDKQRAHSHKSPPGVAAALALDLPFKPRAHDPFRLPDDELGTSDINLTEAELVELQARFPALAIPAELCSLSGHLAQKWKRERDQGRRLDWRSWLVAQLCKRVELRARQSEQRSQNRGRVYY